MPGTVLPKTVENMADLLERLGGVAPHRVRMHPVPGTATEQDLLFTLERSKRLCELVEGVLVEKIMGYTESSLACLLIKIIGIFLDKHDLGFLSGADGAMRLMPGLVRVPDVSFVRWEKLPDRQYPTEPIPDLVPNLAVEVLSEGNTAGEMRRKLGEYFRAGVEAVWLIDPRSRTIVVHDAPRTRVILNEDDTLDGGKVLPGFSLPVRKLFERVAPVDAGAKPSKPAPRRKKQR